MTKEMKELFKSTMDDLKEKYIVVSENTMSGSTVSSNNDTSVDSSQWNRYPKVKKYAEEMTTKELEQAVEGLYHNLNTLN